MAKVLPDFPQPAQTGSLQGLGRSLRETLIATGGYVREFEVLQKAMTEAASLWLVIG